MQQACIFSSVNRIAQMAYIFFLCLKSRTFPGLVGEVAYDPFCFLA